MNNNLWLIIELPIGSIVSTYTMKTLRRKLKNSNDLNALERLLYNNEEQSLPNVHLHPTKGYERGLMISISNNKTHYEEIIKEERATV